MDDVGDTGDRRPTAGGDDEAGAVVAAASRSIPGRRVPLALLAAGAGHRMGAGVPKLLRQVAGRPLLAHAFERIAACAVRIDPLLVIVSSTAPAELLELAHAAGARTVVAPRAAEGMAWSLHAACSDDAVQAGGGVVIALADDPLALDDLPAVLDAVARDRARPVLVERPTAPHPVWLPASLARTFQPDALHPDRGLGGLLRSAAGVERVAASAQSIDADTPADLVRLQRRLAPRSD